MNLFKFWIEDKGIQPPTSWFSHIITTTNFELAAYLMNHSEMPKTISFSFFISRYLYPESPEQKDQFISAETETMRLFALEHNFSLDCKGSCAVYIDTFLKNPADNEETGLFLTALDILPKGNYAFPKLVKYAQTCEESAPPCKSIKKALEIIASGRGPLNAKAQNQQAITTALNTYQSCRTDADCALITFGSCNSTLAATSVNATQRTAVLLDTVLLRNIRQVYGEEKLQNWCAQELEPVQKAYNIVFPADFSYLTRGTTLYKKNYNIFFTLLCAF